MESKGMGGKVRHDARARKCYLTAMLARLVFSFSLIALLAACGACEGRVSNSAGSNGRCSIFSMPL